MGAQGAIMSDEPTVWVLPADKSPTGREVTFVIPNPQRAAERLARLAEIAPAASVAETNGTETKGEQKASKRRAV